IKQQDRRSWSNNRQVSQTGDRVSLEFVGRLDNFRTIILRKAPASRLRNIIGLNRANYASGGHGGDSSDGPSSFLLYRKQEDQWMELIEMSSINGGLTESQTDQDLLNQVETPKGGSPKTKVTAGIGKCASEHQLNMHPSELSNPAIMEGSAATASGSFPASQMNN
ncbi:hypothetical protein Goshw_027657, partial [Gossypium schwendimanii]|nr:hypothetical protein [Gossypium schwendimanii]